MAFTGCQGAPDSGIATTGDGTGSGSISAGPPPATDHVQRQQQYVACLRQHGVEIPDPDQEKGFEVSEPDQQEAKEAAKACQPYAPNIGAAKDAGELARLLDYAACLRRNGVEDFPDPDPSTGLVIPKEVLNSEAFQTADRVCAANVGKPGPSGTR